MPKRAYASRNLETICAAVDEQPLSVTRPLAMPIVAASVFEFDSLEMLAGVSSGTAEGFVYARGAHPNQAVLERLVARLENAEAALACASGMGAIAAAVMAGLKTGDRIVADEALYGRTAALIAGPLAAFGVRPVFADLSDLSKAEQALAEPTAAVIVESISNPLLAVPDIKELARLAHHAGARLIVDNTLATPYHCRPLAHGADLAVHSGSKYLGGHSDAISGVLAGSGRLVGQARELMITLGSPASPFDCWLTARSIKTLALRMAAASANAARLAAFLGGWEGTVSAVRYPGLRSHSGYERAEDLFERGFGAIVSFELSGGRSAAGRLIRGLRHIRLAPSFGDISTTIASPASVPERSAGSANDATFPAGLLRLSAGVEHPDDIIADLRRGLVRAAQRRGGMTCA
jgi:cystathionine gamma-synthase